MRMRSRSPREKVAFYYNLTALRQLSPGDPLARAVKKLSRDMASLDWEEQTLLHFALAKTFADNADYKRSFRHLLDGNALKRKHIHYDETATLAANDGLRAAFTSKLMRKNQGAGEPSRVPVFVVGMPRSGTTLVEQLLCSHPKIFGAGEIPEFFNAAVEVGGPHLEALHFYDENAEALGNQLRQIGASYLARIGRKAPAAERIVNKMPDNFRLAGLIHLTMPNARIIHIRRDPVDTCLSCFSTLFVGENVPFAYDLAELGRYYGSYDLLMAHWNEVLPPNVMLDMQYEELVADVEGQGRRMIAHCGLEWDPRCLNFHQTERPVRTASAVQVRQPIYKTSVGRWRKYEAFLGLTVLGARTRALGPPCRRRNPCGRRRPARKTRQNPQNHDQEDRIVGEVVVPNVSLLLTEQPAVLPPKQAPRRSCESAAMLRGTSIRLDWLLLRRRYRLAGITKIGTIQSAPRLTVGLFGKRTTLWRRRLHWCAKAVRPIRRRH